LDHFADSYSVLGDDNNLGKCELGLDNSREAITTAELFILIWKSMYDIIYHIEESRIAEKMLEKAILCLAQSDQTFADKFNNLDDFISLNDDGLLALLSIKRDSMASQFVESIREERLYQKRFESILDSQVIPMNERFLARLATSDDGSALGEEITLRLCSAIGRNPYDIIGDVVKSRVPKKVDLNELDVNGDPVELKSRSDIVPHIREKNYIKVYVDPTLLKAVTDEQLKSKLTDIIGGW